MEFLIALIALVAFGGILYSVYETITHKKSSAH
jgi:hypothetical protein